MKTLIFLCLAALLSGCAATGNSGRCTGPGDCFEAKRQLMDNAIRDRPFGL